MSAPATVSRWARGFGIAGAGWLVAWQVAALAGAGRRTLVALGLYGFVLHTVFGKAYSLVPSYFDRELAAPRAPAAHLAAAVPGAALLAAAAAGIAPRGAGTAGAVLWAAGAGVFLATVGWTVRDNPTGAETGTGEANADRRPVDRVANAGVPVVLAYLAVGAYGTVAVVAGLPWPLVPAPAVASHLLAAGVAALLLFAVGFRLLPRFLVVDASRAGAAVVLATGAAGPALLVAGFPAGPLFRLGAAVEATAVVGFAAAYVGFFRRTDRERVGLYGPLAGVAAGVVGVAIGLHFAAAGRSGVLALAHLRANLLGFLGITIVGVAYQFYPPAVGEWPGCTDRTALASIAALAGGLAVEIAGLSARSVGVAGAGLAVTTGRALGVGGAVLYAYLLVAAFYARWQRKR